jgi:hypothetical protein
LRTAKIATIDKATSTIAPAMWMNSTKFHDDGLMAARIPIISAPASRP